MTDQNDNMYNNKYKKETSQIHAPVDLIERTKQAVSEEEKRLQMENVLSTQEEKRRTNQEKLTPEAGKNVHNRRNRVLKWALPAAAAAVLVFVLNMSVMLWGSGARKPQMDSAPEIGADERCESGSAMNGSVEMTSEGAAEKADGTGIAESAEESERAITEAEDFAIQQKVSDTEDEVSAALDESDSLSRGDSGNADSAAKSGSADRYDSKKYTKEESSIAEITITKVKNAPAFYDDSDTKRVISRGITFYVAEDVSEDTADHITEENTIWMAYVEYSGAKYMITGQAANQDEFAQKAYEILEKTVNDN